MWWRIERQALAHVPDGAEAIWLACVSGLRDYVIRTGFPAW
jgi:hypothetical protein